MHKAIRLGILIGLALSASAWAGSFQGTRSTTILKLDHFRAARLLTYEELLRLPTKLQRQYLDSLRATLEALDKRPGRTAYRMLLELIRTAYADDPQFCINLGVVMPIDQCPSPAQGGSIHDFDTTGLLAEVVGDAAHCPGAPQEKPCSPFFGFNADGGLNCSKRNWTPVCEKMSAKSATSFLDAIKQCAAVPAGGTIQLGQKKISINCAQLKAYYDEQTQVIAQACGESRLTCARLRSTIEEIKSQAEADPSAQKVAQFFQTDVQPAVTTAGNANKPPCPPSSLAHARRDSVAAPQAATPASVPSQCQQTDLSGAGDHAPANFSSAVAQLFQNNGPPCGDIRLPGDREAKIAPDAQGQTLVLTVLQKGKAPAEVPLDDVSLAFLVQADQVLAKNYSQIPAAKRLDYLLPTQASVLTAKTDQGEVPMMSWQTAAGKVEYTLKPIVDPQDPQKKKMIRLLEIEPQNMQPRTFPIAAQ